MSKTGHSAAFRHFLTFKARRRGVLAALTHLFQNIPSTTPSLAGLKWRFWTESDESGNWPIYRQEYHPLTGELKPGPRAASRSPELHIYSRILRWFRQKVKNLTTYSSSLRGTWAKAGPGSPRVTSRITRIPLEQGGFLEQSYPQFLGRLAQRDLLLPGYLAVLLHVTTCGDGGGAVPGWCRRAVYTGQYRPG